MGTEVLRPQDCLIQRIRVAPAVFHHRRKSYNAGSPNPNPRPNHHHHNNNNGRHRCSDQRRRSREPATVPRRSASADDLRSKSKLVVGQVEILRRGESLESKITAKNGGRDFTATVYGTERLGPAPEMVQKQIRMSPAVFAADDMYAGSAFSLSPSPRALPLPSFFNKKVSNATVDDSATKDLRRLLRLE